MIPFLADGWANPPRGAYRIASEVHKAVEAARARVAELLHADPKEVVFTSCGTGEQQRRHSQRARTNPGKRHVITDAPSSTPRTSTTSSSCGKGYDVTLLRWESDGSLDIHLLEKSIRPDTAIVSVMWANNETGVLFPIEEVAAICRSKGVPLPHRRRADAGQAADRRKIAGRRFPFRSRPISCMRRRELAALYVKRRTRFQPYLIGGHQERGGAAARKTSRTSWPSERRRSWRRRGLPTSTAGVQRLRDGWRTRFCGPFPTPTSTAAATTACRTPRTSRSSFVEAEAVLMAARTRWAFARRAAPPARPVRSIPRTS